MSKKAIAAVLITCILFSLGLASCNNEEAVNKEEELINKANEDYTAYVEQVAYNSLDAAVRSLKPFAVLSGAKDSRFALDIEPIVAEGDGAPFRQLHAVAGNNAVSGTIQPLIGESLGFYACTDYIAIGVQDDTGRVSYRKCALSDVLQAVMSLTGIVQSMPEESAMSSDTIKNVVSSLSKAFDTYVIRTNAIEEIDAYGKTVKAVKSALSFNNNIISQILASVGPDIASLLPESDDGEKVDIAKVFAESGLSISGDIVSYTDVEKGVLIRLTADLTLDAGKVTDEDLLIGNHKIVVSVVVNAPENMSLHNPADLTLSVSAEDGGSTVKFSLPVKWTPAVEKDVFTGTLSYEMPAILADSIPSGSIVFEYNKTTNILNIKAGEEKASLMLTYGDDEIVVKILESGAASVESVINGLVFKISKTAEEPTAPDDAIETDFYGLIGQLISPVVSEDE